MMNKEELIAAIFVQRHEFKEKVDVLEIEINRAKKMIEPVQRIVQSGWLKTLMMGGVGYWMGKKWLGHTKNTEKLKISRDKTEKIFKKGIVSQWLTASAVSWAKQWLVDQASVWLQDYVQKKMNDKKK
jgi:hypothetical protein